jgi:hypothetical protein
MKLEDIINEKWVGAVPGGFGRDAEIFVNPSRGELAEIKDEQGHVDGYRLIIKKNKDVLVWNWASAMHRNIVKGLNLKWDDILPLTIEDGDIMFSGEDTMIMGLIKPKHLNTKEQLMEYLDDMIFNNSKYTSLFKGTKLDPALVSAFNSYYRKSSR